MFDYLGGDSYRTVRRLGDEDSARTVQIIALRDGYNLSDNRVKSGNEKNLTPDSACKVRRLRWCERSSCHF
jgi:hypothetical protein